MKTKKDRIDTGYDHGRVIRKMTNSNLFADKMAILSNNPIPQSAHHHLNIGDKIAFLENDEAEGTTLDEKRRYPIIYVMFIM